MDQWLVRTAKNKVTGPFTGDQVRQFIREKALGPWDEVCCANRYWFFVREAAEVREQLGILPPVFSSADEEITQTETITRTDASSARAAPAVEKSSLLKEKESAATGTPGGPTSDDQPIPDLPAEALTDGDTAMIQNQALRRFQPKAPTSADVGNPTLEPVQTPRPKAFKIHVPLTVGQIERQSIWRGIAWALVILTVFLGIVLFQVLQTH
ncbi:MAG: hypothetical protein AB7P04_05965 [Bacteriovoracia bacterium]